MKNETEHVNPVRASEKINLCQVETRLLRYILLSTGAK